MSRKYKITESQLSKIYERLALSENDNIDEVSMDDESAMQEETTEDDEDVKTESEKPWGKDKNHAPEAHNSKHMAGKMHEELGQAKFGGKSVNGGLSTQTWDKATKPGKTVSGGLKSGGAAKNIEGAKANNGQWDGIKKTSKEATSQVVKGMTAGDVKNSMGVKQPVTKPYDETKITSKEAKAHVKGSLKSGGAAKNIEGAKAQEKNWDQAKAGSVNEKKNSTPSQMRDKKKAAMEEMAKRMDKKDAK